METQPSSKPMAKTPFTMASGDTYQGAAKETDEKLGGILSTLRNRPQK
jgi:hypothetical protein